MSHEPDIFVLAYDLFKMCIKWIFHVDKFLLRSNKPCHIYNLFDIKQNDSVFTSSLFAVFIQRHNITPIIVQVNVL